MAANDADPETGSFGRYVLAKAEVQFHIPDHITFEDAVSSAGSGLGTTGLALYHFLDLPLPEAPPADPQQVLFVYGASTAVGSLAIQLARLYVLSIRHLGLADGRTGPAGKWLRHALQSTSIW